MQLPSGNSQRYFTVPSAWDTCFLATAGPLRKNRSPSLSRRDLDMSLISWKERTPRWSQANT